MNEQWMLAAACRGADTEIWFPIEDRLTWEAFTFCVRCPVRAECLDYALAYGLHGIWGGTTLRQRRDMRSRAPVWLDDGQRSPTQVAESRSDGLQRG